MTGWHAEQTPDRSGRAVIAVMLLALLLVAAVPVALLAGLVMMLLGHVIGGLALFGGSILAAVIAVAVAGMSGMRHLRKLVSERGFGVVRLDSSQYTDASQYTDVAEPKGSDHAGVVRLDRSEYTEVR
jgi:predicted lipid-binding transport protein (Tim44 family)